MLDFYREIKWIYEKKLKISIYRKLFWSFGLASTSDKSPQSPSKTKILGSIYWSKSRLQNFASNFLFLSWTHDNCIFI